MHYHNYQRTPAEDAYKDTIEKYASLANFLCLFHTACELAEEIGKPLLVHANAPGGGEFANQLDNIEWGFRRAASFYQARLKACDVIVQLDCFQKANETSPDSNSMTKLALRLGIAQLTPRRGE
jgi:hypothetical protein